VSLTSELRRARRQARSKRERIRRLRNRISRTKRRLGACEEIERVPVRRETIRSIVRQCDSAGRSFEDVVDRVADLLDDLIEPRNPVWEWISDLGIDLVAFAAVAIWRQTEARLRARLLRDSATLKRLQGGK
jgi:hypothetical protein